jgi:hypothetical protein
VGDMAVGDVTLVEACFLAGADSDLGSGRASGSGSGSQSSKACSKSWVTKSLLFRSKYISLGLWHSRLFVADIQVASFGALQFSFGVTLPPSSSMVSRI